MAFLIPLELSREVGSNFVSSAYKLLNSRTESIDDGPQHADRGGAKEIRLRTQFPQRGAKQRAGAHDTIANQVVRPDRSAARFRRRVLDDQRLAGGVAKFLHPAHGEGEQQRLESVRGQ